MASKIKQESKNKNDTQGLKGCTFESSENSHPTTHYNPKYKKTRPNKTKFNQNENYSNKPPRKGHYKVKGGQQGFGNFSNDKENNDNTIHYLTHKTNYNNKEKPEGNINNIQNNNTSNTPNTMSNNNNIDQNLASLKLSYKAKNDGYNIPISNIDHIDTLITEEKEKHSKNDEKEIENKNEINLKMPIFTGKIITDRKVSKDQTTKENIPQTSVNKNSENDIIEPPKFINTEKKGEIKLGNEDV